MLEWEWHGRDWHVQSILVGPAVLRKGVEVYDALMLWVNTGEIKKMFDGKDYPVHSYINLPLDEGMTLEQALKALPYDPSAFRGLVMSEEIRTACARLVCLLDNDPDLIEPDVLATITTIMEESEMRYRIMATGVLSLGPLIGSATATKPSEHPANTLNMAALNCRGASRGGNLTAALL